MYICLPSGTPNGGTAREVVQGWSRDARHCSPGRLGVGNSSLLRRGEIRERKLSRKSLAPVDPMAAEEPCEGDFDGK